MGKVEGHSLFSKVAAWFMGNGEGEREHVRGMLGKEAFQKALLRERSRADRIGLPLSVLVVKYATENREREEDGTGRIPLRQVARILSRRIRSTDIIGYLEEDKLGIILPHTSGEATLKLADYVQLSVQQCFDEQSKVRSISCVVYSYPDDGRASRDRAM